MTTYYLGGPMTGYPEYNFPAFQAATEILRHQMNLVVFSAHEVDHGEHTGTGTAPYTEYLRGDLRVLLRVDALILLPGWTASKGARLEFEVAADLEYPIYLYAEPEVGRLPHLIKMSVKGSDNV